MFAKYQLRDTPVFEKHRAHVSNDKRPSGKSLRSIRPCPDLGGVVGELWARVFRVCVGCVPMILLGVVRGGAEAHRAHPTPRWRGGWTLWVFPRKRLGRQLLTTRLVSVIRDSFTLGWCGGDCVGAPTLRVARITLNRGEKIMEACGGFGNRETVTGRL